MTNFKDSRVRRIAIQSSTRTGDREILIKMYPKLKRFELLEHTRARRILNILFQYSQSVPSYLNRT